MHGLDRGWTDLAGVPAGHAQPHRAACPYCRSWVLPERKLTGCGRAQHAVEACVPASSPARLAASGRKKTAPRPTPGGLLLHRDQTLTDDGSVEGDPPATDTLGFRWSAADNLFVTAGGDMAADEWRRPAVDKDTQAQCALVWCLPA